MPLNTPLFYVPKISLEPLYTLYDYQLRDHLLETNDIKVLQCTCVHSHNREKCQFTTSDECAKCKTPTRQFLSYTALYFHTDLDSLRLFQCCSHTHTPPCQRCFGCKTNGKCIIAQPFECTYTTDAVCSQCHNFTRAVELQGLLYEHIYNTRNPLFWICEYHKHTHADENVCKIQTVPCCVNAIHVKDYTKSFFISTNKVDNKAMKFICYDPQIWRDQSLNHFISFLRAIINIPDAIQERYKRFETSNFTITNIKEYKGGKKSVVRTNITGFPTIGIYQTATISCILPHNIVLIPQKIYDLAKDQYDLQLVLTKRDPSFHLMCMYVCIGVRNPDPTIDTIIISGEISKPLNQDQDGDKNGIYPMPLILDGYNVVDSYTYNLAKLELSLAMNETCTFLGNAKLKLSEYDLLVIYRYPELFKDDPFLKNIQVWPRIYDGCRM